MENIETVDSKSNESVDEEGEKKVAHNDPSLSEDLGQNSTLEPSTDNLPMTDEIGGTSPRTRPSLNKELEEIVTIQTFVTNSNSVSNGDASTVDDGNQIIGNGMSICERNFVSIFEPASNPTTSEVVTGTEDDIYPHNDTNQQQRVNVDSLNSDNNSIVPVLNVDDDNGFEHLSVSSSSTDTTTSSDSDSQPENYETTFRSRKRPSNASSSETDEQAAHTILSKNKPKHKWFIVQEVVNRQLGVKSRYQGIDLFRQRFYSSLHAVQRLELMYKLENHNGCVNTLNFNSSGSLLASSSDDLMVVLWNWAAGKHIVKYESGHRSNVFQAKFLPLAGDTHIVTCSRDGQIRLGELSSTGVCRSTRKLAAHCGAVHKLAVQTETPHVFLSCAEDALVMSIDVREEKPNRLIFVKEDQRKIALYGIHSNPINNNEFCVNGRNNYIRIYDQRFISKTTPVKKLCPHHLVFAKSSTQVTCAMFNYNGTEIVGSYNDEDIYLFNTKTVSEEENYKYKYEGHRNNMTVKGVNFFGPKSEYIVSGSDCGNIFFWDKATQAIVQWMPGDEGGVVNCLEPHPYIPVIATSGLDSDVKIWVPSNEKEPTMDGLREAMLDNYKSRETDRQPRPDSDSQHMLMILWRRHMRRAEQRRVVQEAAQGSGDGNGANPMQENSSDDSDNEPPFEQCSPS